MDDESIINYFLTIVEKDKDISNGIAAIKTLLMVLEKSNFCTIQELVNTIKSAIGVLKKSGKPITSIASSCELFMCFILTISSPKVDRFTMDEVKKIMTNRGQTFLKKLLCSREVIARHAVDFITDGCKILTIGKSRVVFEALKLAASQNKHFNVFVTMSSIDNEGAQMVEDLKMSNIDSTLILDASIGYIMENIDFVFCGAEGVMESGGIINRIGTYTTALCAEKMWKPFYVLAESFKFSRLYPLNQKDIPNNFNYIQNKINDGSGNSRNAHPLVDYTPPLFITLIFTDLGILTPSAVSDELIKLY